MGKRPKTGVSSVVILREVPFLTHFQQNSALDMRNGDAPNSLVHPHLIY